MCFNKQLSSNECFVVPSKRNGKWPLFIYREHSGSEHSDDSDKQEKTEKRKSFKQQSFLKKSQSNANNSLQQRNVKMEQNTNDSDDSDDDVIIGGSRLNLRNDAKKRPSPRDEGMLG